jgi:hypothetical protein
MNRSFSSVRVKSPLHYPSFLKAVRQYYHANATQKIALKIIFCRNCGYCWESNILANITVCLRCKWQWRKISFSRNWTAKLMEQGWELNSRPIHTIECSTWPSGIDQASDYHINSLPWCNLTITQQACRYIIICCGLLFFHLIVFSSSYTSATLSTFHDST